jgi:hypothetical protein
MENNKVNSSAHILFRCVTVYLLRWTIVIGSERVLINNNGKKENIHTPILLPFPPASRTTETVLSLTKIIPDSDLSWVVGSAAEHRVGLEFDFATDNAFLFKLNL